jgi:hypothetical protein
MPENLKIGTFVFGAILVLIAILGGNFKLFGAEVAATISNRFLRFVAFALGTTFLVVALHSPNPRSGISVVSTPPSPQPIQSSSSSPSPQLTQSSPSPANNPLSSPQTNSSSVCVLTINNPLVPLMSEPKRLGREIARARPNEYTPLGHKIVDRGLREEGWFQIEVEGRKGWIVDDTWTIDRKSSSCP